MSDFKGTPGPWRVERGDLVGVNGERVLLANSSMAFVSAFENPEAVANTQLCHAAPELLDSNLKFVEAVDALYNITPAWSDDCIYDELPSLGLALAYFAARAAIAKATGGDA